MKFLTKSGCCLCERGLFIMRRLKLRYDIDIEVVDIAKFPQYSKYKNKVPVVLINEEEINSMKLNERLISQALDKIFHVKSV